MMSFPSEPSYVSYEERIYEPAVRCGWTAVRDGEFIRLSNGNGIVSHRLGGVGEAEHDRHALAGWYGACWYADVVARLRETELKRGRQ